MKNSKKRNAETAEEKAFALWEQYYNSALSGRINMDMMAFAMSQLNYIHLEKFDREVKDLINRATLKENVNTKIQLAAQKKKENQEYIEQQLEKGRQLGYGKEYI